MSGIAGLSFMDSIFGPKVPLKSPIPPPKKVNPHVSLTFYSNELNLNMKMKITTR